MFEEIKKKLQDNTVIEAGHYSYKKGPNNLDIFLWEMGVKLYSFAKRNFKKVGLLVLVDDVHNTEYNAERKEFDIKNLPLEYIQILEKYNLDINEVIIFSEDKMRSKGRDFLKKKNKSRTSVPYCRLIIATLTKVKEKEGYMNTIVLSDELKTGNGLNMTGGTIFSRLLYNTKIIVHQYVFKDKENFKYYFMPPEKSDILGLDNNNNNNNC